MTSRPAAPDRPVGWTDVEEAMITNPKPESETPEATRWVSVRTVDEMEAFYKAILPQIRTEAKYHGYAIGLHGSMRRDLDLIAIPWSDDHSDKDELARAIQEAACGMPQVVYQWNTKPCGRMSVSIPVCWPEWPEEIGDGHIDLSVMPDLATALSLAQTEIKGLQAERDLHYTRLAGLLFSGALDKYTGGDVQLWAAEYTKKLTEAQARIAELEKERDVLKHHIAVSNAVLKDRA